MGSAWANASIDRWQRAKFWLKANPEIAKAFETDHPIVKDIHNKLLHWGGISKKQTELVLKIAKQVADQQQAREDLKAKLAPLTEGRTQLEGTVLSLKWKRTRFSYHGEETLKMLVKLDSEHKVWGSVPRSIIDDIGKGDRVRFTGTVKRSDDDHTFGFFSRPAKAEKI